MSKEIDLKELWNRQSAQVPDSRELFEKARRYRLKHLAKIALANATLLLTSAFIVDIWCIQKPASWITNSGIVLLLLGMLSFLFVYNQLIPLLMKADYGRSNSDHLQQLLVLKEKQVFLQSTVMNLYFAFITIGVCMATLEYVLLMPLWGAVLAYGATLAWIALNWFVIRPRTIRKQQGAVNELISKFDALNQQLK